MQISVHNIECNTHLLHLGHKFLHLFAALGDHAFVLGTARAGEDASVSRRRIMHYNSTSRHQCHQPSYRFAGAFLAFLEFHQRFLDVGDTLRPWQGC